jgi:hypothetical protein
MYSFFPTFIKDNYTNFFLIYQGLKALRVGMAKKHDEKQVTDALSDSVGAAMSPAMW